MPHPRRLLHIGLSSPPPQVTNPDLTAESIQAAVNSGAQRARNNGYEVQVTHIEISAFDEHLDALRKELSTGNWDALIVGGGLRTTRLFTPQFERVVNAAREVAPGTRVLFQTWPGDIFETAQRGFGDI